MDKYRVAPDADNYVRGLFERLVIYDEQVPVASPQANNANQQCFGFLDRSYPVLDNFGSESEMDYDKWLYMDWGFDFDNDEENTDEEELIILAQICAVLRLRLDRVLSPPSRDGRRDVFPIEHLEKTQVLRDINVLHLSVKEDVSDVLTALGASVTLLSPHNEEIFKLRRKKSDLNNEERNACAEAFRKTVKGAMDGAENRVFDIILADRSTLFYALADENAELSDDPSETTERVIGAIDQERYQHVSSLWQNTSLNPPAACEVFVSKKLLGWRPWMTSEVQGRK